MQIPSIQHLPRQINPQKYCSEPEQRGVESTWKTRAGEKQDSRTERSVMLLLYKELDQGVSLGYWLNAFSFAAILCGTTQMLDKMLIFIVKRRA